jgi:hypothetical protein
MKLPSFLRRAPAEPPLPRVVWMLWLQGWDKAPPVALAARQSWERRSGWPVRALDASTVAEFLPPEEVRHIFQGGKETETLADLIRCGLLLRHGGVWADATTICASPLDAWLPEAARSGFFAFAAPGPDRALSNWFLASAPGNLILARWRAACLGYWSGRERRHTYFWMHGLFAELLELDPAFREAWEAVPKISARHRFHFGPSSAALLGPPSADLDEVLADPPVPVFKLSHKGTEGAGEDSLLHALCRFARGEAPNLGDKLRA